MASATPTTSPTRSAPASLRLVPWGEAVDALLMQCARRGVRINALSHASAPSSQQAGDISTDWETTDDDYGDTSESSDDDMTDDDDLPDEVRAAFEEPAFVLDDYGYDALSEPPTPPSRDYLHQAINVPTFALMRDDTGARRAGRVAGPSTYPAPTTAHQTTSISSPTPALDTALGTAAPIVDLELVADPFAADKKLAKANTSNRPRPRRARKLRDRSKRSVMLAKTTKCKQVKARLPLQTKPPNAT